MDKEEFEKIIEEIANGIKLNKKVIDQAIQQEASKGNTVKLNRLDKNLEEYKTKDDFKKEKENLAVVYLGNPEVTISYMLDSIMHGNNVTLCPAEYKILNEVIVGIVKESLSKVGQKNDFIEYNSKNNELYVRDNAKTFSKIVYVGDYFEYERFQKFVKTDVEYNNYGYIKLFIDKTKFKDEYKKIMEYAYVENISVEVFNDLEDFIHESKKEDYAVLYLDDFKLINQVQKELKSGEIVVNDFPYDNYEIIVRK